MALKHAGMLLAMVLTARAAAQLRAPFARGASMSTLGAVSWADDVTGRQPWAAAALFMDTLSFGVALSGIDYYDDMDNMADRSIRHAIAGGWFGNRYFTVKGAYEHFSALQVYYEQTGYVSLGTAMARRVSVSVEVRGSRVGIRGAERDSETLLEIGATLWVPRRHVALLAALEHVAVERAAVAGVGADALLRLGIHTRRHRWGALGAVAEVVLADEPFVRFIIGEQFRVHPSIGLDAGVCTEPFMLAFGVTLFGRGYTTQAACVHHPELGWSKGFTFDWVRR